MDKPPTAIPITDSQAHGLTHPLNRCLGLFKTITGLGEWVGLLHGLGYNRCWTPRVTLWAMMLGYLLRRKATLEQVVTSLSRGAADGLCTPGKELSILLKGAGSTSAYSQARARLPLPWLRRCLAVQAQSLSDLTTGWQWHGLRVLLLDGSLISLRSVGDIPRWFAPARNQHGPAYWCQMRVLGCLCLGTGLMLATVVSAITESEQAQAVRLILHGLSTLGRTSLLWMGDRNFGVWSVVAAVWQRQSHVLVRLTESRARKLLAGHSFKPGLDLTVRWSRSPHDQLLGHALKTQEVPGRLVVVSYLRHGYRPRLLVLFTTLSDSAVHTPEALALLYARRWQIELSFRQIKAQMGLGQLDVKTSVMAKRELYAGLMAYNLVRGIMLLSAAHHRVGLQRVSFATAMAQLTLTLPRIGSARCAAYQLRLLLDAIGPIGRRLLPRRKKPRPSEPRAKRHHRESFPPLQGSRAQARRMLADLES